MDIDHEKPTHPNDPNRGLNVKVFLIIVAVAVAVIAVILMFAVRKGANAVPKPTQTTQPTSQFSAPQGIPHPKPSPLHRAPLQVSSGLTGTS
jgi:hypothetical protein